MKRRIPLWFTLVPLLAAIALYALLWQGWARDFKATLQPWLPNAQLSIAGFPYRLEATVQSPSLSGGAIVRLTATATTARLNRGPWATDLTVVSTQAPKFAAIVSPLISAQVTGKSALTSINVANARLQRLSTVIEAATARLGITPMAIAADVLELHLRERLAAATPPTSPMAAPTDQPRGQLVITATRLRLGRGDALTLAADLTATGPARLDAYDRWATTGTVEVTRLTLADASGEVASLNATLVPRGRSSLDVAGTVTTICPLSVIAAFNGTPSPSEKRLRAPVRLAFSGTPATLQIANVPPNLAARAIRAQLPPCPAIRRA